MTRRPAGAAWVAVVALVAYAALVKAGPVELLRVVGGLIALWGPAAVILFAALRRGAPEFVPRAVLAATGSYALTTAVYFACCVVWSPVLFYVVYGLAVAAALGIIVTSRRSIAEAWRGREIDWTLVAVVALTLVAFARYQRPYDIEYYTMDVGLATYPDQSYFCAQAYELARHTPPEQQACQAGISERAYHLFPHLAAMLTARFTGEADMMRAHFFSHYATLATLTCLALYVIASRLAGSRVAGYIAAGTVAIFAIPMPAIGGGSPTYLGFTFLPLATGLTEPTYITSPQMFSALAVTFGLLAGVVELCRRLRDGLPVCALAAVCGLMAAAILRFRAQIFIPLFPGFLAVLCYAWLRTRRRSLLVVAAVTVIAAVLLYAEMRRPAYLHETAAVLVGFHPNYRDFMDTWPLADSLRRAVVPASTSGSDAGPAWQTFSIVVFTTLNVIGLPLLVASTDWLRRRNSWRQWGAYAALTIWLVVASIAGSLFLTSAFDPFSLGGQMLLHTGWYLLPLLAVGGWRLASWMKRHTTWSPVAWTRLAWAILLAATVTQATRGFSPLERYNWKHGVVITWNEWLALEYLHSNTPFDSVVIANGGIEPEHDWAVIPGIAGRASYLTYTLALSVLPSTAATAPTDPSSRPDVIAEIWRTTSPGRLATLLAGAGADYLVEFSSRPLALRPPDLLQEVWTSPQKGMVRVRIFKVLPAAVARP